MLLTIALSGMDSATEAALRAALSGANQQLGGHWALVPETESQHVIVDMDSMYGPMSWLRLHAAGKQVIGLTSAPRVQTHFRLGRPFDEAAIVALLREVADSLGASLPAAPVAEDTGATIEPAVDQAPEAAVAADPEHPQTTAPTGTAAVTEPAPVADTAPLPDALDTAPDADAIPALSASLVDRAPSDGPATVIAPAPLPAPAAEPARELPFAAWLDDGVLRGQRRFRSDTGPTLLIDFDTGQYHGPSTLKPLAQYFEGLVDRDAFETPDAATWTREAAAAGPGQPLLRLRWLGGLLQDDGTASADHDPDTRYTLAKWPETEREYPRHFRIATAMMRGPGTLEDIIAGSGMPADEVLRFVNANLATGHAEVVVEAPLAPAEPQKAGGFFSRLRKR